MRHLPHSVDYSNAGDIINELDDLPFDVVKQIMRDIIEDNDHFKKVSERAAIALDQYKELVSLIDGIDEDEQNLTQKKYSIAEIFLRIIFSMKNTSYWLMILSDITKKYASRDSNIYNLILVLKSMSKGILTASRKLKYKHTSKKKKGIFVKNLERESNVEKSLGKRYNKSQSVSENEEDDDRSDTEMSGDEVDKSISERRSSLLDDSVKSDDDDQDESISDEEHLLQNNDDKSDEEPMESNLEPSTNVCEPGINKGEENGSIRDQGVIERLEKRKEKTFGISYLKSQNLFRNSMGESRKTYQNISRKSDVMTPLACDQETSTFRNSLHRDNFSSNVYKKNLTSSKSNPLHSASVTVSKGPRRYYRKRSLSTHENDTDVNGIDENLASSSKRPCKSNRYYSSSVNENPPKRGRKPKKNSSVSESSETKKVISPEKPKSRRGRKKKLNVSQETNEAKSSDNDFERVPYYHSSSVNAMKRVCVHIEDVLDDPEVQHYLDVVKLKQFKSKENIKRNTKRCKEKNEIEENNFSKEANETEVLQEWNVLDAVSDDEDKEYDNDEETGELSHDNSDEQASDSDVDQEQLVNDEIDNNIRTKHLGERCHKEHDDNSSDNSLNIESVLQKKGSSISPSLSSPTYDSETRQHKKRSSISPGMSPPTNDSETKQHKRGPVTPPMPSPELQFAISSGDENDAEADSVRSDKEEDRSPRSSPQGSSLYGKKGPRTPPSPPPPNFQRGPRTPPGFGPESEVSDDEDKA